MKRWIGRTGKLALLAAMPVSGMLTQSGCAPRKAASHKVSIKGFRYAPATLNVRAGDTIIWTNQDIVPHTSTGETAGSDSGSIDPGQAWRYVALKKGSYTYKCAFHPSMAGTVEVR